MEKTIASKQMKSVVARSVHSANASNPLAMYKITVISSGVSVPEVGVLPSRLGVSYCVKSRLSGLFFAQPRSKNNPAAVFFLV